MSRRGRTIAIIALIVVGGAMFELSGAWLFSRGAPWWAALAAALVIFPVAPVAWHLAGERQRKRRLAGAEATAKPGVKKPKPSTLTTGDRFTMRLIAVGLVTLGPLIFFRGGQVWAALRDHPAWFVPQPPPGPRTFAGDGRLLAQVPGDAELVIWARRLDGLDTDEDAKADADDAKEILIALRGGEVMFVARGPDKALAKVDAAELNAQLAELNAKLTEQSFLPVKGPLVLRRRSSDLLVLVSEGWAQAADDRAAGRTGGPDAIAARLAAAPDDAVVIQAAAPATPVAGLELVGMQSWLRVSKAAIRIDAEFNLTSVLAAQALMLRADVERRELIAKMPDECRGKVDALLRDLVIARGDTTVRMRAWWKPEQVGEALMCGLGVMMRKAERP